MEVRLRIAANLLLDGMGIREVARLVGASASSVKRWKDALDCGGATCAGKKRTSDSALARGGLAADKKRGRRRQASIVFLDESGFMLQPVRGWTWAPSGHTPIQHAWDRHDRLSVIGRFRSRRSAAASVCITICDKGTFMASNWLTFCEDSIDICSESSFSYATATRYIVPPFVNCATPELPGCKLSGCRPTRPT